MKSSVSNSNKPASGFSSQDPKNAGDKQRVQGARLLIQRRFSSLFEGNIYQSLAWGLCLTAAALLFESLLGLIFSWELLSSLSEFRRAALAISPFSLIAAFPLALVGLFLGYSVHSQQGSSEIKGTRILATLLVSSLAALAAYGTSHGRHFEALHLRLIWIAVVAVIAGSAAFFGIASRKLSEWLRAPSSLFRVLIALAILLLLWGLDRWLLVRIYPGFHLGLFASAGIFVAFFSVFLPRKSRRWPGLAPVALVLAFVLAPKAALRLSHLDNVRMIWLEQSPWAQQLLRVAHHWAENDAELEEISPENREKYRSESALDLRGKSILLISVDALRADRLGMKDRNGPVMPFIDTLAKDGFVFERAYCPTPHTSYSLSSMMTGKYMKPLLQLGLGEDSESLSQLLRRFGYSTSAFYPPAIFFVDHEKFRRFEDEGFGFEYKWVEFSEGEKRLAQIDRYAATLPKVPKDGEVLLNPEFRWVHLFAPHEPYENHPGFAEGQNDEERYHAEIRFADDTIKKIVERFRAKYPDSLVVLTADHGEEFGEHGGRYHGSSVYEEQIRVPLIFQGAGVQAGKFRGPVQTIDIYTTLVQSLRIPQPPSLRGNFLGELLVQGASSKAESAGLKTEAFAETDDYLMMASGEKRLICERRSFACRLYDLTSDPKQRGEASRGKEAEADDLKRRLKSWMESHGQYEPQDSSNGLPLALRRALQGDPGAATEASALLDDAEPLIRLKTAQALFNLRQDSASAALRLARSREEDKKIIAWLDASLLRLGLSPGPAREKELLLSENDEELQRAVALALWERGNTLGEAQLFSWWNDPNLDEATALTILRAYEAHPKEAMALQLRKKLDDVRLRGPIAKALGRSGDKASLPSLFAYFKQEHYQHIREILAQALFELGAGVESLPTVAYYLGTPDPLANGLELAEKAGKPEITGGLTLEGLKRLRSSDLSVPQRIHVVPPSCGLVKATKEAPLRLLLQNPKAAEVRLGVSDLPISAESSASGVKNRRQPDWRGAPHKFQLGPGELEFFEVPKSWNLSCGQGVELVIQSPNDLSELKLGLVPTHEEALEEHEDEAEKQKSPR